MVGVPDHGRARYAEFPRYPPVAQALAVELPDTLSDTHRCRHFPSSREPSVWLTGTRESIKEPDDAGVLIPPAPSPPTPSKLNAQGVQEQVPTANTFIRSHTGWRWRWTFQNKWHRYSHEGRRDTGQRGEARTCRPRGSGGYAPHTRPAGDLTSCLWSNKHVRRRRRLGVRVSAGRSGGQGHCRPFRRADPGRGPGAAFATLDFPLADVQVFRTDRGGEFDNTRIDEPFDVFDVKGSLSRKGNPYGNAVVESMNRLLRKELVYRNHHTTIEQPGRDPDGCVWCSDDQRLHSTLGYRSPKEFTEQGLVL